MFAMFKKKLLRSSLALQIEAPEGGRDPATAVKQPAGGGIVSRAIGGKGGGSSGPWLPWLLLPDALGLRALRERGLPPAGPV